MILFAIIFSLTDFNSRFFIQISSDTGGADIKTGGNMIGMHR